MTSENSRGAQLGQVLTLPHDASIHPKIVAQMSDYVESQLAGEDYRAHFSSVWQHLDACVACAEAYNLLYEAMMADRAEEAIRSARVPPPDLGFLNVIEAPSVLERLRAAIQRIGEQVSLQLSPDLIPLMRPASMTAPVRGAADGARYLEQLAQLEQREELGEWPASFAIYRDAHQPESCLVEVTVQPPGRVWPNLEGLAVMIQYGDEQRSATTDPWGLAAFDGVPVEALSEMRIVMQRV